MLFPNPSPGCGVTVIILTLCEVLVKADEGACCRHGKNTPEAQTRAGQCLRSGPAQGRQGYFFSASTAWAAASRATGTRNGEQLT